MQSFGEEMALLESKTLKQNILDVFVLPDCVNIMFDSALGWHFTFVVFCYYYYYY
jgi:hypothetical protein